jgi:hypothetical protein
MYSKYWLVVKDDTTRTFEVINQVSNDNAFTNKIHGMQKSGMNISCATPPVTNKTSSKSMLNFTGYTREDGLYDRLLKQYMEIRMKDIEDYE